MSPFTSGEAKLNIKPMEKRALAKEQDVGSKWTSTPDPANVPSQLRTNRV